MADKSQQLIITALSQAVACAEGLPLFGSKSSPGLFPSTAVGKQAAQRCLDEGYLRSLTPGYSTETSAATATRKPRPAAEWFSLTEKGFTFLFQQVSPRQVLQDLVRVLEQRQTETTELTRCARHMQQNLEALRSNVEKVLQTLQPATDACAAVEKAIRGQLSRWEITSGASEDCPLPELFRQVQAQVPRLSLGQFHDVLRRLHDEGSIYLHPWTGPLYDLPEPPKALLVGHEIAYYASLRTESVISH